MSTTSVAGTVGSFNQTDWYSFSVVAAETVNLDLSALVGSGSLTLYDSTGKKVVGSSSASLAGDGWLNESIAAGTYYVSVSSSSGLQYMLADSLGTPAVGTATSNYAGTTMPTARSLGTLGATPMSIPEWVGLNNTDDWYSFNVANASLLNVTLAGLSTNETVYLRNAAGQQIAAAYGNLPSNASLLQTLAPLAAGTYYLDIQGSSYNAGPYNLQVSAQTIPETAGLTQATAKNLGVLGTKATTNTDQVNPVDVTDYYAFQLASTSTVSLTLTGLTSNAAITLYNAAGTALVTTSASATGSAYLVDDLAPLASGLSYTIGITDGYTNATTPYTLTASAVAYPSNASASSLTPTVVALSSTAKSYSAALLALASNNYYSFTLTATTVVNINLSAYGSNIPAPAQFSLVDPSNNTVASGQAVGSNDGIVSFTLTAGTYTTKVSTYFPGTYGLYNISFSSGSVPVGTIATDTAGTTLGSAKVVAPLTTTPTVLNGALSATSGTDYYRLTLTGPSLLTLDLLGTNGSDALTLLDASGKTIAIQQTSSSSNDGEQYSLGASVIQLLTAGTYYAEVSGTPTGYSLKATSSPVVSGGGPGLASAANIGGLTSTTQSYSGTVNAIATDAYFQFTLASSATVNLLLSGLSYGTYLKLEDVSGNVIVQPFGDSSYNSDASVIQSLAAGTYFADVSYGGGSTNYSLALQATPIVTQGAASIGSATSLGVLDPSSSTGTGSTGTGSTGTGSTGTGSTGTGSTGTGSTGTGSTGTGSTGTGSTGTSTGSTGTSGGPISVSTGGTYTTTASTTNTINVPVSGTINTVATSTNSITLGTGTGVVNSAGTDTITAGSGAASVTANGATYIIGGAGALTVNNGAGTCVTFGGTGGVTYTGGTGFDIVVGKGGPVNIHGGTGGGDYWGAGNSTVVAGSGAQAVLIGYAGDQLFSAGSAGDLFGANAGGNIVMSGVSSTGNDVFFGAAGTGTLTFITGSGNDILGLGQGTNTVTLGAGHSTVFANTGTSGVSTITAGTGSADIGLGGKSVNLIIGAANARNFALFNFVPGADKITLTGYSSTQAATALASQTVSNGITQLTLSDKSVISLIGVTHADSSLFG